MAKEEKANKKRGEMRPFLDLLEDEFQEESSENHQGKTSIVLSCSYSNSCDI